ncbi:hypothetical protein GGQ80_002196 [Sphingomonas jinjuensis]|uniref:Uncharacterized protein n=1 Tax=Sphingomonas jinjuensis TaxID=535907 RepID=A0A840FDG6_9SPHN|nr:hypothetical protein [Sphingomonas jinjuensis]
MSDQEPKPTPFWKQAALAGVILFAPGGFILGATLLAQRYRNWQKSPSPRP